MAIIVAPLNLSLGDQCKISQRRYDTVTRSEVTGAAQARIYGFPRWKMTLICNEILTLDEGALWESIILKLRGGINHLQVFDYFKQLPLGTFRDPCTVKNSVAAGVSTIVLAGGAGNANKTLAQGDWVQLGSSLGAQQLVKVVDPASANGSGDITINIEPPTRIAFSAGASVTLQRATTFYKAVSTPEWEYNYGGQAQQGFALDLLEQWS